MFKVKSAEIQFILLFLTHLDVRNKDCTGRILRKNFNLTDENLLEITVNTPITLECQLDEKAIERGCRSNKLSFYYDNTPVRNRIQYHNNSLQLKVDTSTPNSLNVTCTYGGPGLYNEVIFLNIGVSPQLINLKCLNVRLRALVCYYRVIKKTVKETVTIEIQNQTSGSYQIVPFEYVDRNDILERASTINDSFNPFDRIIFRVSVSNSIGPPVHDHVLFETEKIIVLPKSFEIELKKLTTNNMIVTWNLPQIYNKYEFNHTRDCGTTSNLNCLKILTSDQIKTRNLTNGDITFELDLNVPYANTEYILVIYTAVKNARVWLDQRAMGVLTIKTMKRIPDNPPQITPDSFEYIEPSNDVKFYWKPINTDLQNGDDFHIILQEIRENGKLNKSINVTLSDTWAILKQINPRNQYIIQLFAENSEGKSENFSTITIPTKQNLHLPPTDLKIVRNESIYQLSWTVSTGEMVDNFTIFWCTPLGEQTTNCQKLINTKTIPGNQTSFNSTNKANETQSQRIYAISSNFKGKTSGMKWFTCITSTNIGLAKIEKAFISQINATSIKLTWTLACETSPYLKAINITYCQWEQFKNDTCETVFNHLINNQPSEVTIDKLVPYTEYILELSMFDGNKSGPLNRTQFKTGVTDPDVPTELKYYSGTNSSVKIYWTPPIKWNGKEHDYKIHYETKIESNFLRTTTLNNFTTLERLRSNTKYTIRVAACHDQYCSTTFSDQIVVKTNISKPEKITCRERDGIYEWPQPSVESEDFKVYELRFILFDGIIKTRNSLTSETKCTLPNDVCNYDTYIRAINLNEPINTNNFTNNNLDIWHCNEALDIDYTKLCSNYECMPGDWEIVAKIKCGPPYNTRQTLFYIFVPLTIFVIVLVFYKIIHIGMRRYKIITDLHVSVPSGLDKIFEFQPQDKCHKQFKTIVDISDHKLHVDESQTITFEELQNEWMELKENKFYFPKSGSYLQSDKQNVGYVQISDLT